MATVNSREGSHTLKATLVTYLGKFPAMSPAAYYILDVTLIELADSLFIYEDKSKAKGKRLSTKFVPVFEENHKVIDSTTITDPEFPYYYYLQKLQILRNGQNHEEDWPRNSFWRSLNTKKTFLDVKGKQKYSLFEDVEQGAHHLSHEQRAQFISDYTILQEEVELPRLEKYPLGEQKLYPNMHHGIDEITHNYIGMHIDESTWKNISETVKAKVSPSPTSCDERVVTGLFKDAFKVTSDKTSPANWKYLWDFRSGGPDCLQAEPFYSLDGMNDQGKQTYKSALHEVKYRPFSIMFKYDEMPFLLPIVACGLFPKTLAVPTKCPAIAKAKTEKEAAA